MPKIKLWKEPKLVGSRCCNEIMCYSLYHFQTSFICWQSQESLAREENLALSNRSAVGEAKSGFAECHTSLV